jgi:hypothetical protein
VTLSPPVRIVALAGLLLALAAAGVLEYPKLKHRFAHAKATSAPVHVSVRPAPAPAPAHRKPAVIPGMPPVIGAALRTHDTVVAFVYSQDAPGDLALVKDVRDGAKAAGAAFVPLNVADDTMAVDVYAWTKAPADPEVLVVKRPGRVAFAIQGATDSVAVQEAAANAK